MLKWLFEVIVGNFCKHDWDFIEKTRTFSKDNDKRPHTITNNYICKKCGNFKKVSL